MNMTEYFSAVNLLKKRDFDTDLLLVLIKNGVKDKIFLENKENLKILAAELATCGYKTGEIDYDYERNIHEMDISDQEDKQVLVRVGREILSTNDYQRMLKNYKKIESLDCPTFSILSKAEDAKKITKLDNLIQLFEFVMSEAKKGINIQRYKGLGEMNADQLWETTMNPEKRNMLRVDIEDAEKADEIFTLLMGEEVEPRRNFIQKHALEVSSLDY
ncbi:MAG: DNA gyrase subunit B, partial [Desulfobacteraceae bacterium]|nr:DNA gyrase subunit B [Desulfobacteraceae bacterium]